MKLSTLHSLSRRLDASLHEFALTADAKGDYPWQPGQRRHQRQRTAAGVAGSLALGGGLAYGANRAGRALKERYGVKSVKDGAIMGAAEGVQKLKGAAVQGVDKLKTAAAPMMAKAATAAAPVIDPLKRKIGAGKLSYGRGIAQKQGAGKIIARVGRALIHASRADVLVELEAKLDQALHTA